MIDHGLIKEKLAVKESDGAASCETVLVGRVDGMRGNMRLIRSSTEQCAA